MSNPPKKIVILGPESTGKSTLAKELAVEFGEPWVPEYSREYLHNLGRTYGYEDLLEIAKGQIAAEEKFYKKAKQILICDTDLRVIDVWSQHKFGKTHPWILNKISQQNYDFFLLTDIDMPWQFDPLREHPEPEMRKYFFNLYLHKIDQSGVPYKIISGNANQRLKMAMIEISSYFQIKK